jgi:hypothetical protein
MMLQGKLVEAARIGDPKASEALVGPHRRELHVPLAHRAHARSWALLGQGDCQGHAQNDLRRRSLSSARRHVAGHGVAGLSAQKSGFPAEFG